MNIIIMVWDNYGIGEGEDKVICTDCFGRERKWITQDGKKCIKCKKYDEVAPFGECIKELYKCDEYNEDYTCRKCKTSEYMDGKRMFYFLDEGKCKLCPSEQKSDGIKCFNHCKNFDTNGICKRCDYSYDDDFLKELNYYLEENLCKQCENNQPSDGIKCLDKIPNCKVHEFNDQLNKLECHQCENNYFLDLNNKCSPCQNGMLSEGYSCYKIIENCAYQLHYVCRACNAGYSLSLYETVCSNCPNGQISNNGVCKNEIEFCYRYFSNILVKNV